MRKMVTVVGLMLVLVTGMWAQGAKKPAPAKAGGDTKSMILEMEHKWTEAGLKGDPAMVDSILADSFLTMDTDGKYKTKKEYMEDFKKDKWTTNEVSDLKVAVHGNFAQVTGIWKGKGTVDGKAIDSTERWLDTFMKMPDGSWKAVSSAATKIK
jgi:ketosteroid isomerase-like protein